MANSSLQDFISGFRPQTQAAGSGAVPFATGPQGFNPGSEWGLEMWTPNQEYAQNLYGGMQGLSQAMPGITGQQMIDLYSGGYLRPTDAGSLQFNPLAGYGMEMWSDDIGNAMNLYTGLGNLSSAMPGLDATGLSNLYQGGYLSLGDDWNLGFNPYAGLGVSGFSTGNLNEALDLYSGLQGLSPEDQSILAQILNDQYGGAGGASGAGGGGGGGLFSGMQNAYPTSYSSGGGSSYSGIDWNNSPVSFEQLQQLAQGLPGAVDQYGHTIYNKYRNLMRTGLEDYQGVLNTMVNRGMMGSSDMTDAMTRSRLGIMEQIGNQAYDAQGQAELLKINLPSILAQLAQLGQYSMSNTGQQSSSSQPNVGFENLLALVNSGVMA